MAEVKTDGENMEPEKKPAKKRATKKAVAEVVEPVEKAPAEEEAAEAGEKVEAPAEPKETAPADDVTELDTPAEEAEKQPKAEEVKRFCYMGPTLRKYGLIENMVYTGTVSQMAAMSAAAAGVFPGVKKMIFEAKYFEKIKKEKAAGKNYICRLYDEIKKKL